ncbi:unnamed protein product, partial [marine sediment metagenome]
MNVVERIDDAVRVEHVLVSVFDKTDLELLVSGLLDGNPEVTLYATGATHAALKNILGADAKNHLLAVAEYTGQPEMQG